LALIIKERATLEQIDQMLQTLGLYIKMAVDIERGNPGLPPIKGSFFKAAGVKDFQRSFELATLRLRNMSEVLSNWRIYVLLSVVPYFSK
jgi:hypothetical protein